MNLNKKHNQKNEIPKKIQNLFNTAHEVKLSPKEKMEGRLAFHNFITTSSPVISPYTENIFMRIYEHIKDTRFSYVIASVMIACLVLTSTAYAAQDTLPGDFLYPVKVHVNENIETAFAIKTEDKAKVAVKHAITRVKEIESLAELGKINNETENALNDVLAKQSQNAQDSIVKLTIEGNVKAAIAISSEFENSLHKLEKRLDTISKKKHVEGGSILVNVSKNVRRHIDTSEKLRLDYENTISTSTDSNTSGDKNRFVKQEKDLKYFKEQLEATASFGKNKKKTHENKNEVSPLKPTSQNETEIHLSSSTNQQVESKATTTLQTPTVQTSTWQQQTTFVNVNSGQSQNSAVSLPTPNSIPVPAVIETLSI